MLFLNDDCVTDVYVGDDKKIHIVKGGADSVLPFSGGDVKKFTKTISGNYTLTASDVPLDATIIGVYIVNSTVNYNSWDNGIFWIKTGVYMSGRTIAMTRDTQNSENNYITSVSINVAVLYQ